MSRPNRHGLTRDIPESVKRHVRKRCGFGCVICGLGIYQYEHFNPEFSNASEHNPNGITLLCPNHHNKKTTGKLAPGTVERYNANPKALRQGFANEHFDLRTNEPIIVLGNSSFRLNQVLIQIEDEPILMFKPGKDEDEPLCLNATLRDRSGNIILSIVDNEWISPITNWDVRIEGKLLEIRSGDRKIELLLRQEPPNMIFFDKLLMHHKGYIIEAYKGKNLLIISPYKNDIRIGSITGNSSVGMMFYGSSVGIGLSPYVSPEEGLEILKREEERYWRNSSENNTPT